MTHRKVDKERLERADRESKLAIEAERQIRNAKTKRLREQRLLVEAAMERPPPAERRKAAVKNTQRKNINTD
ncbi:hypothetical protein OOJ09_28040 [Mesorhizobium qingshengii]|uniref:Transcriptional regulator n=1 Tax=Mesorhizobium qingshengii TaxID=1165689 RepID=A0ABT4R2J1_9HYPH|nr:hypothetical protein [Mesorhizobium qingshengii]MCZ8548045.1 hypothetical protein [Mesorhizobium qingshengii]